MEKLTDEEKEKIEKLSKELRTKRARCSQYCSMWDSWDKDCDIYGDQHLSPSRCLLYLKKEALK